MKNTFANRLLLTFLINFVPYPSDCLNKFNAQLFTQILDMRVNYPLVTIKVIPPQLIQQVLPRHDTPLMGQQFPQYFKLPLCQFISVSVHRGSIIIQIQKQILIGNGLMPLFLRLAAPPQDSRNFAD